MCTDDATRIILQGDEDYINANYVNVSHTETCIYSLSILLKQKKLAFLGNKEILF